MGFLFGYIIGTVVYLFFTAMIVSSIWDGIGAEDRKWASRFLVAAPVWPLVVLLMIVGLLIAALMGLAEAVTNAVKNADLKNFFNDIRDEFKDPEKDKVDN